MRKLVTLIVTFFVAVAFSACSGSGGSNSDKPVKTFEAKDYKLEDGGKTQVELKIPTEMKIEDSSPYVRAKSASGDWELLIITAHHKDQTAKATWDATTEQYKSVYGGTYKAAKVAGKEGAVFDMGSGLKYIAPIDDASFLSITIEASGIDAAGRQKIADGDVFLFIMANIKIA